MSFLFISCITRSIYSLLLLHNIPHTPGIYNDHITLWGEFSFCFVIFVNFFGRVAIQEVFMSFHLSAFMYFPYCLTVTKDNDTFVLTRMPVGKFSALPGIVGMSYIPLKHN